MATAQKAPVKEPLTRPAFCTINPLKKGEHMYVDTHTHFDNTLKRDKKLQLAALLAELTAAEVKYVVQVSIDVDSFRWSYDFARKYRESGVFFTLGLHPSSLAWDRELEELDRFVARVVKDDPQLLLGIGECGLDYFRMHQSREMQTASFEHQLYLAKKYNLPVIIHTRDATADTLQILQANTPLWGIMHCFPGDKNDARRFLDLGFYLSFAGNVTYKKARELHDSATYVPLDRLLVETDAPYLTPEPLRGKTNKPVYVTHTYAFLADLRKQSSESLQTGVLENFEKILKQRY